MALLADERWLPPATGTMLSVGISERGGRTLAQRCVDGIAANVDSLRAQVENSIGLATALNPLIAYTQATSVAQEAAAAGRTVYDVVSLQWPAQQGAAQRDPQSRSAGGLAGRICVPNP
jgi:aspartate ammonia-lyase